MDEVNKLAAFDTNPPPAESQSEETSCTQIQNDDKATAKDTSLFPDPETEDEVIDDKIDTSQEIDQPTADEHQLYVQSIFVM